MEGQKSVVGRLEGQSLSSVGWKVKSLSVSHRWNGRSKVPATPVGYIITTVIIALFFCAPAIFRH